MKLNLGCGRKNFPGYVNVDFIDYPEVDEVIDLERLPWDWWKNSSAEEILMFDFLEHLSYRKTDLVLMECWRILQSDGVLQIQVPDFEECARAALQIKPYDCHKCGYHFTETSIETNCKECHVSKFDIADAALRRLYGGQIEKGDWHQMAFTKETLKEKLERFGFKDFQFLEKIHQRKNWNFKISCKKDKEFLWF